MKGSWLHRAKSEKLIIFCGGWGMDATPFQLLTSSAYDVYMLYHYLDLVPPQPIEDIVHGYRYVYLVSWSMGVWVGQKLFSGSEALFHCCIAINGTLCPVDDELGIPKKIFADTLQDFGETTRTKFYRRMCREKDTLKTFLARQPRRLPADQRDELAALQTMSDCVPADLSIYQKVIIAGYDWIIPSANQRRFWFGKETIEISGFHFPFYLWPSWDQLVLFADSPP